MSIDVPAQPLDETDHILYDLIDRGVGQALDEIPDNEWPLSFIHYATNQSRQAEQVVNIGPNILQLAHQILDCRTDGLGCNLRGCDLQPTAPDAKLTEITELPEGFTS